MGSLNQPSIPVIDLTKEKLNSASSWLSTTQEVVRALEEYGCFVAIYDKVSLELHEAIFDVSKELFDLPVETKILNRSDVPLQSYISEVPSFQLFEALTIEDPNTHDGVDKFTNLMWPSGNQRFRETVYNFSNLAVELNEMVMRMVCERYGIEEEGESLIKSTYHTLKLIKYRPPCDENETNLGVQTHTDQNIFSLVHQHQVKGLEMKTQDGKWVLVDPSPSSFVVVAGDPCMAWTNGRIRAVEHRVIMSEKVERYSLGLFPVVKNLKIKVPKKLIDEEHPLKFKPFDHYEYIRFTLSTDGKKFESPIVAFCGI